MPKLKTQTRSGYRCEHQGCGGYTEVLRTFRDGSTVVRYRRCTTCKATVTTKETKCGPCRVAQ